VRFRVLTPTEDTGGAFACIECIAEPNTGSSLHIHHNEDEHILVLEGVAHLRLGEQVLDPPARQTITMPRGIPHSWNNMSDTALRFMILFSPSGFDRFSLEIAANTVPRSEIRPRYGLEVVGPRL